jgi:hypothetical protein
LLSVGVDPPVDAIPVPAVRAVMPVFVIVGSSGVPPIAIPVPAVIAFTIPAPLLIDAQVKDPAIVALSWTDRLPVIRALPLTLKSAVRAVAGFDFTATFPSLSTRNIEVSPKLSATWKPSCVVLFVIRIG